MSRLVCDGSRREDKIRNKLHFLVHVGEVVMLLRGKRLSERHSRGHNPDRSEVEAVRILK